MGFFSKLFNGENGESALNHLKNAVFVKKYQDIKINPDKRFGEYYVIYRPKSSNNKARICEFFTTTSEAEQARELLETEGHKSVQHGVRLGFNDYDINDLNINFKDIYY